MLIWLDNEKSWLAPRDGSPARPSVFSDAAVQLCLTIKGLFKLPLRQTDLPRVFHPATTGVLWSFTPFGAG